MRTCSACCQDVLTRPATSSARLHYFDMLFVVLFVTALHIAFCLPISSAREPTQGNHAVLFHPGENSKEKHDSLPCASTSQINATRCSEASISAIANSSNIISSHFAPEIGNDNSISEELGWDLALNQVVQDRTITARSSANFEKKGLLSYAC